MLPQNKPLFDYLGITQYHNAGIKGKGLKVLVYDVNFDINQVYLKDRDMPIKFADNCGKSFDTAYRSFDHGVRSCSIIDQILPEAEIHFMSRFSGAMSSTPQYAIDNNIDIVSVSMSYGTRDPSPISVMTQRSEQAINKGVYLCSSAGNSNIEGITLPAKKFSWISVGASLYNDGNPIKASYSSIGGELEIMSLTNLWAKGANDRVRTYGGTSCSCPTFVGCLGLFISNIKRKLSKDELRGVLYKYCKDLGIPGRDALYGYGIFRLPNPNFVR